MKYRPKKQHRLLIASGFLSLIFIPVLIVINKILKSYPDFVEKYYTNGFFKAVSGVYGFLTNLIPVSLIEIVIIIYPVILIILFIRAYRRATVTNRAYPLIRYLSGLCAAITVMFAVFSFGLSFNYNRPLAGKLLSLNTENPTKEELSAAFSYTVERLSEITKKIEYNEKGVSSYKGFFKMSRQGALAFSKLSEQSPVFSGARVRPKPAFISSIAMNYLGITGVYSPFTNEANVNILFPDFSLPQTMCHEIAHLRGFMREDEAEYIGYLACVLSDDRYFNYSGYMYAYNSIGNALYKTDKTLYSELAKKTPSAVLTEWKNYFDYSEKFEGKITELATKANNTYLKIQGQKEGVISYSNSIKLIIGQMRKEKTV